MALSRVHEGEGGHRAGHTKSEVANTRHRRYSTPSTVGDNAACTGQRQTCLSRRSGARYRRITMVVAFCHSRRYLRWRVPSQSWHHLREKIAHVRAPNALRFPFFPHPAASPKGPDFRSESFLLKSFRDTFPDFPSRQLSTSSASATVITPTLWCFESRAMSAAQ